MKTVAAVLAALLRGQALDLLFRQKPLYQDLTLPRFHPVVEHLKQAGSDVLRVQQLIRLQL